MADVFSKEKRSEVMSRIRSSDTTPERVVRSILHRLRFRFTVNGPKNRTLPGRPDIVLPKYRTKRNATHRRLTPKVIAKMITAKSQFVSLGFSAESACISCRP